MILQQLTLRNFGLYVGENAFDLSPARKRNRQAPIILFGGVNGGGKTTILDAIQLVLYGNRARCSKRAEKSYDTFLRESIHHGIDPTEGAAVQLAFRFAAEGEEHLYEVSRSWSVVREKLRERVDVSKDGDHDEWLSENWNQVVEELIPFGIAQLCFFDAEKIRFLAEDETSSEALGVAIKSLLGLDLAERLIIDAASLQARQARQSRKSPDLEELERLENELASKQSQIEVSHQEIAALENPRLLAAKRLNVAEDKFARMGGKHWAEREEQLRRRGELEARVKQGEDDLVSLAATELPLTLVPNLLAQASKRAQFEKSAVENQVVIKLLKDRDESILNLLKAEKAKAETLKQIRNFLEADRSERATSTESGLHLKLTDASSQLLDHLTSRGLSERLATAARSLKELDKNRRALEQVHRTLAATPDEESIRQISEELQSAAGELKELTTRIQKLESELDGLRTEHSELDTLAKRLRRKVVDEQIRSEEDGRVANLLQRTQETMKQFLKLSTARKIDRLSELVSNSFRYLLRKKTLVEKVLIDPSSFAISLLDHDGNRVPKERLSEGEKQIFAISVLWGLSQASARQLPAIIDTPMARLDAGHRDQLVELYFPRASHQVIILSTDTEIEWNYFQQIQPHIARAYHLNYDEVTRSTMASEGYFWDAEGSRKSDEVKA
ncbi:MAG: DNA sulfur modification protein DndD [Planctomycetaceae bacterium]